YYSIVMQRIEEYTGEQISDRVIYKKSFAYRDFVSRYHSYRGNAYGLANTLSQTAVLKPRMRNKKMRNFFYAGQLTVPGPGVPPSLISGHVAAGELIKNL
ncbi:MAG: phytoene desaturase family protein, partial [Chitinophagales bacterium]